MKLKKRLLALALITGITATPITAYATHIHMWGAAQYYGYKDVRPFINDPWEKCTTRYVYNQHQCLTCGEKEIYLVNTIEREHDFSTGVCPYCSKGYLR